LELKLKALPINTKDNSTENSINSRNKLKTSPPLMMSNLLLKKSKETPKPLLKPSEPSKKEKFPKKPLNLKLNN